MVKGCVTLVISCSPCILQISQDATEETEQQLKFVTFDLVAATKAYALVLQHPGFYRNVYPQVLSGLKI